jgi:hypothetical protein
MASDGEYDTNKYDILSMEEKGLIAMPRLIEDVNELRRVWKTLHAINARRGLRDRWIRALPSGYECVLETYIVEWLWTTIGVIPDALRDDWINVFTHCSLYALHVMRQRANAMNMASMKEYEKAYIKPLVYSECMHVDGDDFFIEVNRSNKGEIGDTIFYYSLEKEQITKEVKLDRDLSSGSYPAHTPLMLRHALEKWRSGKWSTYHKGATTLLKYAISLIRRLNYNRYSSSTFDLPYYADTSKVQWSPGTIFVPNELREHVEDLISNAADSPNLQFLRNYYTVASEPILRSLHEITTKEAMSRKGSSCCIQ